MNEFFEKAFFVTILFGALISVRPFLKSIASAQAPRPGTVVIPGNASSGTGNGSLQLQTFPYITLTPTPTSPGSTQNTSGNSPDSQESNSSNNSNSSSGNNTTTAGGTLVNNAVGGVPLYHQWDPRWRGKSFGCSTTMAAAACGPTSLAMVISYYTGKSIMPPEIADVVLAKRFRVCGSGTAHAAITAIPPLYGLKSKNITWQQAKTYLSQGIPVVQVHGPGYFTGGGHYIVLTKNSPVGSQNYLVNDPDGRHRTNANESQITASLKQSWVILK